MLFHHFDKSMKEVKADIDAGLDVQLIDVRLPQEYEEGHIPGAILLPLPNIDKSIVRILPNKNAVLYVYCRSGQRSSKACRLFKELGYTQVYNIGGIQHWEYPIEKSK